jgi:V/A-type H+-transporting ATPase subunit C
MAYSIKSFSKASRYGHAVGRVMVHENTLLTPQLVARMVESDLEEALGVTSETVYGPYLEGASSSKDVEEGLLSFLTDEFRFMDQICAGTLVAKFMHLKYDFHNLKVLLKQKYLGDGGDALLSTLGRIDVAEMRRGLDEGTRGRVPVYLWDAARAAVADDQQPDPQRIDTVVDRAFLQRRLEIAKEEGSRLLVKFCRAAVDVANLNVLLRGAELDKTGQFYWEALADGGDLDKVLMLRLSGEPFSVVAEKLLGSRYGKMFSSVLGEAGEKVRLTSLDRASDEFLLEQVSGFSVVSMGPERIVRFMLTRENEVAMLRTILLGKLYNLTPDVIESRLPAAYVKEAAR